ncbi:MAG: UDP-3-O-[3-hydroxymyristoyl] glucosamine N-acyltransferase [Lysobacterales bacterium]|jgi:UDP-3-O-[3-hydroxymyristoyl] glucosamine N-acyltransferase
MKITLAEIAKIVDGKVSGDENLVVTGLSGIEEAKEGELTFLDDKKFVSYLDTTNASAIIVPQDLKVIDRTVIFVDNPSLAFAKVIDTFTDKNTSFSGVHKTAVVAENVTLGSNITLGPHVVISDNCSIGDNTFIMPGVSVGNNSSIGKDCVIHANVSIYHDTVIGDRVSIHSGSVIGSDGFGYTQKDGVHHKLPQIGCVVIEDDVEIGGNVVIDRARFDKTIIRRGTKIDNLVQIAHNVDVGEGVLIISQAGISGSCQIGKGAILAGQSGIAGHLSIGDGVIVAGKAGVTKSVLDKQMVSGYPAKPHKHAQKVNAAVQRLPVYVKTIRDLKKRIQKLEERVEDVS